MLAPAITTTLDHLLLHIDRFGMHDSASQIDQVLRLAHRQLADDPTVEPVVEVLADAEAPMVLRERALARLVAELRVAAPAAPSIAA